MRSIKVIVAVVLLLASLFMIASCVKSPEDEIREAMGTADPAKVQQYTDMWRATEAKQKGDTYCKDCEKFIEGKVRICPYCGQYI